MFFWRRGWLTEVAGLAGNLGNDGRLVEAMFELLHCNGRVC